MNGSQLCTTKLQRASSYERFRPFNRDNSRPRDGTNFPTPEDYDVLAPARIKVTERCVISPMSLGNARDYGPCNEGSALSPPSFATVLLLSWEFLAISFLPSVDVIISLR